MPAAKTAKRRSEAVNGGTFSRFVAEKSAHAGVRVAELAAVIYRDTHDGDEDFSASVAAVVELQELGVHLSDTQWKVADGDYGAARDAAAKL